LLLFLLLLFVIFQVRRSLSRKPAQDASPAPERAEAAGPAPVQETEVMLPCAHCGVHVPESEGVTAQGRFYCSAAHRQAGPRP
jgi:uncharacterized protein